MTFPQIAFKMKCSRIHSNVKKIEFTEIVEINFSAGVDVNLDGNLSTKKTTFFSGVS
jgi:hypothetical protein